MEQLQLYMPLAAIACLVGIITYFFMRIIGLFYMKTKAERVAIVCIFATLYIVCGGAAYLVVTSTF